MFRKLGKTPLEKGVPPLFPYDPMGAYPPLPAPL